MSSVFSVYTEQRSSLHVVRLSGNKNFMDESEEFIFNVSLIEPLKRTE